MSYSEKDVSAAIATLGEMMIIDMNVVLTDQDGLAAAGKAAEDMIMNELIRSGMSMAQASATVNSAASRTAKGSMISQQLSDAAMQNRNAPVVENNDNNDDNSDSNAVNNADTENTAQGGTPAQQAQTNANPTNKNQTPENNPASTNQESPKPSIIHVSSAKNEERAQRLGEKIPYTVEEVKITDIFNKMPKGDPMFDFTVPVFTWARPHPNVPVIDPAYSMDAESLFAMLYGIACKKSTAIVGPHGCGKTRLVEEICARINMPLTTLPMDGSMGRSHLFGQEKIRSGENGSESYYQYGLLPAALEEPGMILFDEFDRADESIQYACHSVYEQRYLKLLEHDGRNIPMHRYNRVSGTSNTKGRGSDDGMYQGAMEMSEATRDRWSLWLEMDYQSVTDDLAVLKAKVKGLETPMLKIIARFAENIRNSFTQSALSQTCSMRQQLETAEKASFIFSLRRPSTDEEKISCLEAAIKTVILSRANEQDKASMTTMLTTLNPLFGKAKIF